MKKLLIVCLMLVSGNAFAAIANSAHDFANGTTGSDYKATGTGASEICAYCHTPHSANTAGKPLWNKASFTQNSYTAYGTTIAGTSVGTTGVPTGTTQLCLGCHDGSVAPGVVSNPPNSGWTENTTTIPSNNSAYQDTTFANDHPVGFVYSSSVSVTAGSIISLTDAESAGFPMDASDNMTCATCHNVHNESGAETLLVQTNAASAMCQACHNK